MSVNCWVHKRCGREPGGALVHDRGVCPAAVLFEADGIHGGKNAGRACWAIEGTFCDGDVQASFLEKLRHCAGCDFRRSVEWDEGADLLEVEEIVAHIDRARSA